MVLFISAGLLSTILAFLSQFKGNRRLLLLSFFIIAVIMGLQDAIGNDFPGYEDAFREISLGQLIPSYLNTDKGDSYFTIEVGWYYLNLLLSKIIFDFHLVSFSVSLLFCYSFYKLLVFVPSKFHWLAVLLFYFSIEHMFLLMSALRQTTAMACFVLVVVFSFNKKIIPALIFALLGTTFHNSFFVALSYLLVLFLPYILFEKNKKILCSLFLISFVYIALNQNSLQSNLVERALPSMSEDTARYSYYIENLEESSVSTLASLFSLGIFLFSLFGLYNCKNKHDMIILLYAVVSYLVLLFLGNNSGSMTRGIYYMTFFNVAASCIIANYLRNPIVKYGYITVLILITGFKFITALTNFQYIKYLDYHTIFF